MLSFGRFDVPPITLIQAIKRRQEGKNKTKKENNIKQKQEAFADYIFK